MTESYNLFIFSYKGQQTIIDESKRISFVKTVKSAALAVNASVECK